MKLILRPTSIVMLYFVFFSAFGQGDTLDQPNIEVKYTDKGFQFTTADKKFRLHLESRFQFRFASPGDQNPLTLDDLETEEPVFKINRARLKVGGHAFDKSLKYYWEYELAQGNLLDFRLMFEKLDALKIKIGQWKTYYNRERVVSSGKQQMAERSIITRPFTIDRQQGISLYGNLFPETTASLTYHLSVLTGTGRGSFQNDDSHLMYVGRVQWNFLKRELGMTSSDLEWHEKPTALLAVGALTNRSPFTRFSQAGGGQLIGFTEGVAGQYRVNQGLLETALMYKGFAWQSELHFKEIKDRVNLTQTTLLGSYYQAGYFFSNLWELIPQPLELAARYARYTPNRDFSDLIEEEFTIALNWFFKGHRNKLTTEFTVFDFETEIGSIKRNSRIRVQWDISF